MTVHEKKVEKKVKIETTSRFINIFHENLKSSLTEGYFITYHYPYIINNKFATYCSILYRRNSNFRINQMN